MTGDYRTYGGRADRPPKWWDLSGDKAAQAISATLDLLRSPSRDRALLYQRGARLYGNVSLLGLSAALGGRMPQEAGIGADRLRLNIVQSVIDTIAAKIGKSKPRAEFLSSGGDYAQQRAAQRLTKFVDGIFYENEAYALGADAFRDGCVWGDGFVHVFEKACKGPEGKIIPRVAYERVMPFELFVDELEGVYGQPRQMHRVKLVDRDQLEEMFPGAAGAIQDVAPESAPTLQAPVADLIEVRESWHLPSGPGASDGRHVITIKDCSLTAVEDWPHDFFPFARFRWSPRMTGYFSQGLAEQLQSIQIEINKLLQIIQRSFHLGGTFKVFLANGSKIVKGHLDNDIGAIVTYTGTPPQYVVPPLVPPEIYQQLNVLIQRAYEQSGVSQLSAGSLKPAGLDSGRALREYNDIETDRFQTVGKAYERLFLDLASITIATARGIAERNGGSYPVKVPSRGRFTPLDLRDIELGEDDYTIQCFPVSSLPREPAGRLKTIQEYIQAGFLDQRQGRRLLDFPDLEQVEGLANAEEDYLQEQLDGIVDEGKPAAIEPFDDLMLARQMALQYYAKGRSNGLSADRLELLRTFLSQIDALEKQAAIAITEQANEAAATMTPLPMAGASTGTAPPAGSLPSAPPIPTPPSEFVPQVMQ